MRLQAAGGVRGRNRGAEQVLQEGAGGRSHGLRPETMRGLPWRGNIPAPPRICFAIAAIDNSTCQGFQRATGTQRTKGIQHAKGIGQWCVRRRAMVARHPRWKVDVPITILSVVRSENLQDPS